MPSGYTTKASTYKHLKASSDIILVIGCDDALVTSGAVSRLRCGVWWLGLRCACGGDSSLTAYCVDFCGGLRLRGVSLSLSTAYYC